MRRSRHGNLYWKTDHGDLSLLTQQPFKTEEELETISTKPLNSWVI